jgi:hypothetical protein
MAKRRGSNDSGTGARGVSLDILNTISRVPSSRAFRVGGPGGLTKSAIGQKTANSPIQFGSPSSRGNIASSTNKSRGGWTGLLGSIGGKGLSDLLGGGVLSSGLDYLVGGFESLFGAGSAPNDTISRFELPDSQNQSIVVNNVKTPAEPTSSGVYGNSKSQISQASKAAIVQTVKNALLTSSSLNDVIGEL